MDASEEHVRRRCNGGDCGAVVKVDVKVFGLNCKRNGIEQTS